MRRYAAVALAVIFADLIIAPIQNNYRKHYGLPELIDAFWQACHGGQR